MNNNSTSPQEIYVNCPHCDGGIEIHFTEINCNIFRHGIFKVTGMPMNPHESKENCEKYFDAGLIHGCGKPFELDQTTRTAVICDYI